MTPVIVNQFNVAEVMVMLETEKPKGALAQGPAVVNVADEEKEPVPVEHSVCA